MKDLTQGPIPIHVIEMASPMVVGMFVQTLYNLLLQREFRRLDFPLQVTTAGL